MKSDSLKQANKTCRNCKEVLPKTREYFFFKTHKQTLSSGKYVEYCFARANCKKCHTILATNRNRLKRCKEMGCDLIDYKNTYLKIKGEKRRKIPELYLVKLTENQRNWIYDKIRKGYKFTTFEQYKIDCKNELISYLVKRGANYSDLPKGYEMWKDVDSKLKSKIQGNRITPARLANWLGLGVSEAHQELIKTKEAIVKLNRLIKKINTGSETIKRTQHHERQHTTLRSNRK